MRDRKRVGSRQGSLFFPSFLPRRERPLLGGKKSVVLLLLPVYSKNKHIKETFSIRLKRLTSAGVSISCESCFTCACVRSHSITTRRINVTAVRVGRAFVDIYIQTCCYSYKNLKASSLHTYIIFSIFTLEFWSSLQGNILGNQYINIP